MDPWTLFDGSLYTWGLEQNEFQVMLFGIAVLVLVDLVKRMKGNRIDAFLAEQCIWFRWGALIVLFICCVVFGVYGQGYDASQFIYFQF